MLIGGLNEAGTQQMLMGGLREPPFGDDALPAHPVKPLGLRPCLANHPTRRSFQISSIIANVTSLMKEKSVSFCADKCIHGDVLLPRRGSLDVRKFHYAHISI